MSALKKRGKQIFLKEIGHLEKLTYVLGKQRRQRFLAGNYKRGNKIFSLVSLFGLYLRCLD
jgi:hypothetical protein